MRSELTGERDVDSGGPGVLNGNSDYNNKNAKTAQLGLG
jgi:hypothetical protein